MQRIEAFLNEDEVPDWASSLKRKTVEGKPLPPAPSQPPRLGPRIPEPAKDETRVGFKKAIFTWSVVPRGRQNTPFTLGPLNLAFPIGKLSLVSGPTGSGKTALLLSLLGGEFSESLSGWVIFQEALRCRNGMCGWRSVTGQEWWKGCILLSNTMYVS
jgi:ABC-type transport system involved in cytochrome bd biosynthesis fused ATPase/permease subunit